MFWSFMQRRGRDRSCGPVTHVPPVQEELTLWQLRETVLDLYESGVDIPTSIMTQLRRSISTERWIGVLKKRISASPKYQLRETFQWLADKAREARRPLPVISTDFATAKILQARLAVDLGCYMSDLEQRDAGPYLVFMFDGIKFVADHSLRCQRDVDGWREHFGDLADIFGGA